MSYGVDVFSVALARLGQLCGGRQQLLRVRVGVLEKIGSSVNHSLQAPIDIPKIWAFPSFSFGFYFPFSRYIARLQLKNLPIANDDRKQERRRKSMHCSIARYLEKADDPTGID